MSSLPQPLQHFLRSKHDEKVSISDKTITSLQFEKGIDALGKEHELKAVIVRLRNICTKYKTEVSAEKAK